MTKPRIAITLDEMSVGGIPVACISFLEALKERADITMILESDKGAFTEKIPEGIKVVVKPNESISTTFKALLKKRKFFKCALSAVKYFCYSRMGRWIKASAIVNDCKELLLDDEFDCAIAYHGMNAYQMNRALGRLKAKKYLTWIHGDHAFNVKDFPDAEWLYQHFDRIYCVSEVTRGRFLEDFPSLSDKTDIYYVHMPVGEIIEKSKSEPLPDFFKDRINIVTVGRVSSEKGQDLVPSATKLLIERGINVHWYLVGDGDDRARIEKLIDEEGMSDHITLLGNKTNPYPYMLACDLYVQPSYTEGFGITIFEAAILGKPVVATDVGGANELLRDSEELLFVQPTPNDIANGIERILTDEPLREHIQKNISKRDFSNRDEVEKIITLIKE